MLLNESQSKMEGLGVLIYILAVGLRIRSLRNRRPWLANWHYEEYWGSYLP